MRVFSSRWCVLNPGFRLGCAAAVTLCLMALTPYVDQTASSGLPMNQAGEAFALGGNAAVFDADGDGDLDLFLTGEPEGGVQYFRNDSTPGFPKFVEGTEEIGLGGFAEAAMGLAVADFDGDSLLDLFVATKRSDRIFIARGDGTFAEESEWRLPGAARFSNSPTVADFDLMWTRTSTSPGTC